MKIDSRNEIDSANKQNYDKSDCEKIKLIEGILTKIRVSLMMMIFVKNEFEMKFWRKNVLEQCDLMQLNIHKLISFVVFLAS